MSFGDENKDIYKEKCLKIKTNIWSLLHQNNTNEIIIEVLFKVGKTQTI